MAAIEPDEKRMPLPPSTLLEQARFAARVGVSLDTVLRRYFAGYALLGDFLLEEAEVAGIGGAALKPLLARRAELFDRLVAAVSEAYASEQRSRISSREGRQTELVQRLLSGEAGDTGGLAYEFDDWHLGAILCGPGGAEAIRELARTLDRRLLLARPQGETLWAWLSSRQRPDVRRVTVLVDKWPASILVSIGEPGRGIDGWRFTHRQAKAALRVAQSEGTSHVVRYADAGLIAAAMKDDVLMASLRQQYLNPLTEGYGDGRVLIETLRAYFRADRNITSAAAALGVSRQTVRSRVRAAEDRIGRPLGTCAVELELATRLPEPTRAE